MVCERSAHALRETNSRLLETDSLVAFRREIMP